jgi:transcriptional regulator with XRE-family HTH domain
MKSLKQLRQEKGLTLIEVEKLSGINNVQLNEFETGKHIPGVTNRKMLENFYGEKINFLDVPIKVIQREPASDWNDTEREFRYLLKMVASLPSDEMESFCRTSSYHLDRLWKNINENEV